MHTIEILKAADESGTIHVVVPGQAPNREYRVTVAIEPSPANPAQTQVDPNGWPAGFFDRLAGSWEGEFGEVFEGDFERRAEF